LHSSQSHDQLHHSLHILCGNGTTISNIYTLSLHDALPILEKIMRAPQWIGASPSNPFWDMDGETLYFSWNPENAAADSLYKISIHNKLPVKISKYERAALIAATSLQYNKAHTASAYEKNGDLFYYQL